MQLALAQAALARDCGEVPVGAVVVHHGVVVGVGHNTPLTSHDPSAHAEMQALRAAAKHLGNYRLDGCELFVTLEPCTMCAGAMLHARLQRVVFGAPDPKTGAAGSVLNVFSHPQLNHHTQVQGGVLADACATVLRDFFSHQRSQQRQQRLQNAERLREDALRTPETRFVALVDLPQASFYVCDLPTLNGFRLHYLDNALRDAAGTLFCLHPPSQWCYAWRDAFVRNTIQGHRVVCPDLIGFGKSDKPKKAAGYTLQWHVQVLHELLERLNLRDAELLAPPACERLADALMARATGRLRSVAYAQSHPLGQDALDAPFLDSGHTAMARALASF